MRRLPLASLLAACFALAACGPVRPELVIRSGGFLAESYGFTCECGSHLFLVLGRPAFGVYRVRCEHCEHEWVIREPEIAR